MFFVVHKNEKVWRIQVINSSYRTIRGIGLGSTLDEVRLAYVGITPAALSYNKSGLPYLSISDVDGRFAMPAKGFDFEQNTFPGNAKIINIAIGGDTVAK